MSEEDNILHKKTIFWHMCLKEITYKKDKVRGHCHLTDWVEAPHMLIIT